MATLTETLDNLYTTTWYHRRDKSADNIFDAYPLFAWMRNRNRMERKAGGRRIEEPLEYGEGGNIAWINKGDSVTLADTEILTVATYNWKYLVGNVVRFGVDDQQNRGRMKVLNFATAKLNNVQKGLEKDIETKLFAGTASGNEIDGLQALVADDPTTGTVGGLNAATYSWWRNKATNLTGLSFAAHGDAKMRTMLNNVSNNNGSDQPDIIVTGQNPFEYYEDSVLDYYRISSRESGDLSFQNLLFKGIPMFWSPSCGTRMYFLNTDFLKMVIDPMLFFDMTEWKPIPSQVNDRVAQIILACSFITSRRRAQGVIYNIDTE